MASMRDIKRRESSIGSTEQITNAMKLVSTVKLQRARVRAEESAPYFACMYETVHSMISRSENIFHPYLRVGSSPRRAVVVITSNRGLAGAYNANIVRMLNGSSLDPALTDVYAIGSKGAQMLARLGYSVVWSDSQMMEDPTFERAGDLSRILLDAFCSGAVGEIWLLYTHFKNTVVHIPRLIRVLPASADGEETGIGMGNERKEAPAAHTPGRTAERVSAQADAGEKGKAAGPAALMNYEPDEQEALSQIIPKYVTSLLYGALAEAVASENGARMQAMDSATNNAQDMLQELDLAYNRARQGAITQEITEIIAGANAIE